MTRYVRCTMAAGLGSTRYAPGGADDDRRMLAHGALIEVALRCQAGPRARQHRNPALPAACWALPARIPVPGCLPHPWKSRLIGIVRRRKFGRCPREVPQPLVFITFENVHAKRSERHMNRPASTVGSRGISPVPNKPAESSRECVTEHELHAK